MDAELARRMALVAYGNAFLLGLVDSPPDLLKENSAFQEVSSVEFRTSRRSTHRIDLWLSYLAKRGANRLWVRVDDLAVDGPGIREVWLPSGVFISKRFEDRQARQVRSLAETGVWNEDEQSAISSVMARTDRPWRLLFTQEPRKSRPQRGVPLHASRAALADTVTEAREFSRRHDMGYVGSLDKALSLLRSRKPVALYHPDVLPQVGYSLDARRVLAAAMQAWIFGAWGWGDRMFEDESVEAEFWRLDAKLQASVVGALLSATNSFDASEVGRNVA